MKARINWQLLGVMFTVLCTSVFRAEASPMPVPPGFIFEILATTDVPDPNQCTVIPADGLGGMLLGPASPDPVPASVNEITVRYSGSGPVAGAAVVVLLSSSNPACAGAILNGITDSEGKVSITLAGYGCADHTPMSGVIKANGVTIRAYINVKSPDFDGSAGNGIVNLSDLIAFARAFNGSGEPCHDYDNNGLCNLSDLSIFASAFVQGNHCP